MTTAQEVVMRWSLVLLLPAVTLAAPVPKAKDVSSPPFPMTVGDTREYEFRTGDNAAAAYSNEVTGVEKQRDGSTHVTISQSVPYSGLFTLVFAVSDTGVTQLADGDMELPEPELLLKLPTKVGTKWELNGAKYEVVAEEEVKVGAGRYRAAKVEMTTDTGKTAMWFAPGVGLVKLATEGSDTVLELKAFKPGK